MKLAVLVIAGFLAVSTNAAPGLGAPKLGKLGATAPRLLSQQTGKLKAGNEHGVVSNPQTPGNARYLLKSAGFSNADADQVASQVGKGSQVLAKTAAKSQALSKGLQGSLDGSGAGQSLPKMQGLSPNKQESPQWGQGPPQWGPDVPFPFNLIMALLNKDGINDFNLGTVCNSIQNLDFQKYQQYFSFSEMAELQNKMSAKDFYGSMAEWIQQASSSLAEVLSNIYQDGESNNWPKKVADVVSIIISDKGKGSDQPS